MSGMSHEGAQMSQESPEPPMPSVSMPMESGKEPWPPVPVMALLSFLALAAGVAIALLS